MRILLSNDDGVRASGLKALADALRTVADIFIVAPDRDRSGASNSLTLDRPLRAVRLDDNVVQVDGTPTDCVHLAMTGLLDFEPDMVVSGINAGSNLGDDVIYSGTVAAAMEGRFLGLPAIAISLAGHPAQHFATAARAIVDLVGQVRLAQLPTNTILNVNVPDLPWDEIRGFETTRLGHRHKAEPAVVSADPRGREVWWIGPAGPEADAGPGTDFHAVNTGHISVTPIHVDLTRYDAIDTVARGIRQVRQ